VHGCVSSGTPAAGLRHCTLSLISGTTAGDDSMAVSVSVNRVESLGPLGLRFSILSQEFLDRHVPTTDSDSQVAVFY